MRVREPGLRLREMGLTRILLCDMRHFLGVARLGERRAGQSLLRGWRNERFPSLMPGQAGGNGAPQEAMSVPFSKKAWVDEADQGGRSVEGRCLAVSPWLCVQDPEVIRPDLHDRQHNLPGCRVEVHERFAY